MDTLHRDNPAQVALLLCGAVAECTEQHIHRQAAAQRQAQTHSMSVRPVYRCLLLPSTRVPSIPPAYPTVHSAPLQATQSCTPSPQLLTINFTSSHRYLLVFRLRRPLARTRQAAVHHVSYSVGRAFLAVYTQNAVTSLPFIVTFLPLLLLTGAWLPLLIALVLAFVAHLAFQLLANLLSAPTARQALLITGCSKGW